MIINKLTFFFKHQIWHIGGTIILFYIGTQVVNLDDNTNTFIGISALSWFMIAMSIPLIHQVYVWVCWRSELCWQSISKSISLSNFETDFQSLKRGIKIINFFICYQAYIFYYFLL